MLSRDLTASVIKTFFGELGDVRDGRREENSELSLARLYVPYFYREKMWFVNAGVPEITALLADDTIRRLEMLTELMYQDVLTSVELRTTMCRKIIELYDVIDSQGQTFSLERTNRRLELQKLLNE